MNSGRKQNSALIWLLPLGLIVATALYYFAEQPVASLPPPRQKGNPSLASESDSGDYHAPPAPQHTEHGPAATAAPRRHVFPRPRNAIDQKARLRMLAALAAKLSTSRAYPGSATRSAEKPEPLGTLSKEYIQQAVREIVPLFKECFELGLAENPNLEGKIKVRFTIIADEQYGGLVEDSQVLDDTELAANPTLNECFRETIYALKIRAPSGGGRVTVTYPFVLRQTTSQDDQNQ